LERISHHCEDSVKFLHEFGGIIDILYLDSYNWKPGESGAADHQLAEIQACINKVSTQGVIVIDDIFETIDQGKAALSIPFMQRHGWNRIEQIPILERKFGNWYQAIIQHDEG
jgi:hypothetical protein